MKISFTDWSRRIYLPSIGWEWDRAYAFPYLGKVPLPRWALPRWAQEFRNHRNRVEREIKSPVGGVTLKLFQAGSSFVVEAPLSLEHHSKLVLFSAESLEKIVCVLGSGHGGPGREG